MFRQLFLIVTCVALLAGCGDKAPAATSVPTAQQNSAPTAEATPVVSGPTQGPREYSTEEVTLPQAGTIVPPATEDPTAGKLFDSIELIRSGGIAGKELSIVLQANGSLMRDGVASTIPVDQVKQISDMLDKIGFFGLQGVFQAPGTSADKYSYSLTAERNGSSRTINAQEGYIPPELAAVLQALTQLGAPK